MLSLKNRGCPEFTVLIIYFLAFRIFEQLELALKNRIALIFSLHQTCILYYSGILSNLRFPWKKTELPINFSLHGIYFLHSEFLSNLRLPWKTEGSLNLLCGMYISYYSGILSNLRFPWKTEPRWNFSLYWIYVIHSGVLSNLPLPWKTELPRNFSLYGIYSLHS